ncbi:MAG: hypothetical protein ACO4AV_15325, partial [bacterium]
IYHMEKRVKQLLLEDTRRHQMDAEPGEVIETIEDELLPSIEKLMEIWDYDPTPQYLYDNDGGEPPLSANERHAAAWKQHQALHS